MRVDRHRIVEIQRDELADVEVGRSDIETDHLSTEVGELLRHLGADTGSASGDDDPTAVVAPQLVDVSHCSDAVSGRVSAVPPLS